MSLRLDAACKYMAHGVCLWTGSIVISERVFEHRRNGMRGIWKWNQALGLMYLCLEQEDTNGILRRFWQKNTKKNST